MTRTYDTYRIRTQWFGPDARNVARWHSEEIHVTDTAMHADAVARTIAAEMDERYGETASWNVTYFDSCGRGMYEYFHGRIS